MPNRKSTSQKLAPALIDATQYRTRQSSKTWPASTL